jgi:hypothetical protein
MFIKVTRITDKKLKSSKVLSILKTCCHDENLIGSDLRDKRNLKCDFVYSTAENKMGRFRKMYEKRYNLGSKQRVYFFFAPQE